MKECICNACGMEFTIEKLDVTEDTLKGNPVEVVSFTCPKCDERYVISVRDRESAKLREELQRAREAYRESYDPKDGDRIRRTKNEVSYRKKALMNYMGSLKKKYLKELRKRGK